MADIFQEIEEDIRQDRYQRLVKAYGNYVIGAALLVVAGTAGYVLWKNWHQARQQTDTLSLVQAVDLARTADGAKDGADALAKVAANAGGGTAQLARFYEAGTRANLGDRASAVVIYDAIARDINTIPLLRDLATLLSIQLQVDAGDPKTLTGRLDPLTVDTNPWRFSARELAGLLAARVGDTARAKTLFQQLGDDHSAPSGLRARAAELAAYFGKGS